MLVCWRCSSHSLSSGYPKKGARGQTCLSVFVVSGTLISVLLTCTSFTHLVLYQHIHNVIHPYCCIFICTTSPIHFVLCILIVWELPNHPVCIHFINFCLISLFRLVVFLQTVANKFRPTKHHQLHGHFPKTAVDGVLFHDGYLMSYPSLH